ncbi:sigma-70 family RNA polymerase sigma factor [Alkalihalobacillus macyae]|uniref:sigma-70 family RNA polymerase sigma factor n=1 Tax=Guptibacillus hwajinpoensis TaxID=208199 RepID=UPI00273BF84C|nr:sigma-70 family RNA polymerase sigma factor [Alkalihalobacillus macyae]MDP4549383.1 sigma-70 family RNA polymerase sigma factor [Alkalihalobacillus macyae]
MNEVKLVKKAKKGDKKAFETLLVLHKNQLYRTAFLYVQNREDALDVVQDTAFKSYLAIGTLKEEKYILTWLTKILIRCAYDSLKKRRGEVALEKVTPILSRVDKSSDEVIDLANALNELKDHYRDVIVLFHYHDLSIKEVANVLELPENTVKTYLHRGRKQLKTILEEAGSYEGKTL